MERDIAPATVDLGDRALVDHIARGGGQADITTGDDTTGLVDDVVPRQQIEAVVGLYQATVGQIVTRAGRQVVAGTQGPGIAQVLAGDQLDIGTLDQRTVSGQAVVGIGQVQHRYQHLLAVDLGVFQPDDVMGQGSNLFGRQADADRQVEFLLALDGVVHQVFVEAFVRRLPIDKALAGSRGHRLLDQFLFIETIAQALGAGVRVITQVRQQVVRPHELLEVSQYRVGFDQVLLWAGLTRSVRQTLHPLDSLAACRELDTGRIPWSDHIDHAASDVAGGGWPNTLFKLQVACAAPSRISELQVTRLRITGALLTLGRVDCRGAHGLGLGCHRLYRGNALSAETEQTILAGRQTEARQGHRIDLLLCQVRRQLSIEQHHRRQYLRRSGCRRALLRDIGMGVFDDRAVDQVFRGIDRNTSTGLDHCGCQTGTTGRRRRSVTDQTTAPSRGVVGEGVDRDRRRRRLSVVGHHIVADERVVGALLDPPGVPGPGPGRTTGHRPFVGQVVGTDIDVAGGGDGAVAVDDIGAIDRQVTPGLQAGLPGVFIDGALEDFGGDVVGLTMFRAGVVVVDANAAGDKAALVGQFVLAVEQALRPQGHVTLGLETAGDVFQLVGASTVGVAGHRQCTEAIDIALVVGQGIDLQAHVTATEQQRAVVIQQVVSLDRQVLGTGQGAVVGQAAGNHAQASIGSQATGIAQQTTHVEGGVTAARDTASTAQAERSCIQSQGALSAVAAVTTIAASQVQAGRAIAGDQAIVVPVAAAAGQVGDGQQLTASGLVQSADVDGQSTGLDHAAVGPVVCRQGQTTTGRHVATGIEQVGRGNIESTVAYVLQAAALVLETTDVQGQVAVGGFQFAVTVVEQAADLEVGLAAAAQGAQLAGLVVQAGRAYAQGAVTFDDAEAVVEGAIEAQVDALTRDLAIVVAAVVEVVAGDLHQALGIDTAVAVIEVGGGDQRIAALCRDPAAVVVDAAQRTEVQALALDNAALAVVVQVVAVFQHADDAGFQRALEAAQSAATVVQIGRAGGQVAVLGNQLAALVVDITGHGQAQGALPLQRALAVGQAGGVDGEVAGLAVDQAIGVVLHSTGAGDLQVAIGSHGAAIAVVEAAGQQAQ